MGVPSFYRWLTGKYPNIVVNAKEDKADSSVDRKSPNPNGMEFDNLYLDMNAIIHPSFHPQDDDHQILPPTTFEEVFGLIFGYIDRLFNLVRPHKLLYLAIDGVAPRAKMNQQRARRFRTAKDAEIAEKEEDRLRRLFLMEGKQVQPKEESEVSDSNVITPGTEFMFKLSEKLQSYIRLRMNNSPTWKDIKVILSDANVPGEGEHKIMSFIRLQRTFPGYDPDTRHCLYGLDADLIMLALATHEIRLSILREDLLSQMQNPIPQRVPELGICESGASSKNSRGWFKKWESPSNKSLSEISNGKERSSTEVCMANRTTLMKKPYQFLHIWILREYLELDITISDRPDKFEHNFERIVDDFIFMCFFAANDFLPHMPSLELHEGAIDLLLHVYKTEFKNFGGYLVDMQRVDDKKAGYIKLKRVEKFILLVSGFEEKIFKKRSEIRERKIKRILSDYEDARDEDQAFGMNELTIDCSSVPVSEVFSRECHTLSSGINLTANTADEILRNTKDLKAKLKEYTRKESDIFKNGCIGTDKVRLGAPGHKERYYREKFGAKSSEEIEHTRTEVVEKYTEGLCWVLLYYFSGVPSWSWYYPYHYGPFASDLKGLSQVKPKFQEGLPFKPFDQLMGVFPPRSALALPAAYQHLMTSEESTIIDFYPRDFEVDVDGKRYTWQGTCKLLFIEEARLLAETRKIESELKGDEAIRNSESLDQLFITRSGDFGSKIMLLHKNLKSIKQNGEVDIDVISSGEIKGFVFLKRDGNAVDFADVWDASSDNNVLCVFYKLPPYRIHIPRLLEGVKLPEQSISEADILETPLWHEGKGSRPNFGTQNSQRQWKTSGSTKSSINSSPAVVIKGAGTGWGGGRGKITAEENSRTLNVGRKAVAAPYSSSRRTTMANEKHENYYFTPPVQYGNYYSSEKWIPMDYCGGEASGTEGFKSCGRARPENNNVWQPCNRNWRQSHEQANTALNQGETSGTGGFKSYGRVKLENNNVWQPCNRNWGQSHVQANTALNQGETSGTGGFKSYGRVRPENNNVSQPCNPNWRQSHKQSNTAPNQSRNSFGPAFNSYSAWPSNSGYSDTTTGGRIDRW